MNTHKALIDLSKINDSALPFLILMYQAKKKEYYHVKGLEKPNDYIVLDNRTIMTNGNTEYSKGFRKVAHILEKQRIDDNDDCSTYMLFIKDEHKSLLDKIGMDVICNTYNQSKELSCRMYEAMIKTNITSINNKA